eukprot:scaffold1141_cov128-Isochrysis_galbana.AAC.16
MSRLCGDADMLYHSHSACAAVKRIVSNEARGAGHDVVRSQSRYLVGLTNIPREPRGHPIAEVVRVGDEVGVVPLFNRLLLDRRRAWWGLAFALLRKEWLERGGPMSDMMSACGVLSVFGSPSESRERSAVAAFAWKCRLQGSAVVDSCQYMVLLSIFLSLSADCVVVLRLCGPSQRGAQLSTDLRHRPIGVTGDWLSGHSEAFAVAIWLTMLPCADSRGPFGDEWMSMTVSFGSEAEGAARARKRYTLAATLRDTPCLTTLLLSLLFPIIFPSFSLFRPLLAGGWFKSCVHYNSLRLGLENLGENVEPSYVRDHLDSLRADYG